MVIIFFLEFLGFFDGINNYVYDLSFRLRGPRDPGSAIVIAAIDEKTLDTLGQWPIQRRHYARLIDAADHARVIAFDIVFSEPSADDKIFADAIKRYGRVVLPVYVNGSLSRVKPVAALPTIGVGHVHVDRDVDGTTRRVFHNLYFNERPIPSFGTVAHEVYKDNRPFPAEDRDKYKGSTTRSDAFVQADPMWINYYGPPGTFLHVSFADVLSGRYDPEFFKGRIVLVGVTAVGIETEALAPFSQTRKGMSGVEVQANILANLLNGDSITVSSDTVTRLLSLLVALLCFVVSIRTSERRSVLLWLASLAAVMAISFCLLALSNIWFPPALLCIALTYSFGVGYIIRLNEAAARLDQEYSKVLSSLRWVPEDEGKSLKKRGFLGLLNSRDLNKRVKTLSKITEELLFEKNLVDTTLSSYVYGIVLFDSGGRLAIANDRAKKLFANLERDGKNDFEDFILALLPQIIDAERPRDAVHFKEQAAGTICLTVSLSNPGQVFLKMDVGPVRLDGKEYYLFVFSDVTKLKEMETRKSEAVSIVSHELKQPLQIILGYSELISMGLARKTDEYAKKIVQEAERMNKLIGAFLGIARLESGTQTLLKTDFEFPKLFSDVISLIEPIAATKRIRVLTELPSPCSKICLDRDLLVQCLLNLLENAIKYSPEDREVRVQLKEEEALFSISVTDRGYGIDAEEIPHIFDKFYRIRSEETKDVPGSGLGLCFVKEAVNAMGGNIAIESERGRGSTFTLAFVKQAKELEMEG